MQWTTQSGRFQWTLRIEWMPFDIWIGLFAKRTSRKRDLYLCLVPMLPIHLSRRQRPRARVITNAELVSVAITQGKLAPAFFERASPPPTKIMGRVNTNQWGSR